MVQASRLHISEMCGRACHGEALEAKPERPHHKINRRAITCLTESVAKTIG